MVTLRLGLLLSAAVLVISGCNTAPLPQAPPASRERPSSDVAYDRTYQAETRHRHHHGSQDNAAGDGWGTYDRDAGGLEPRSHSRHNSRALTAAPGQFDFYLLNLSWSPEFCHSHAAAPECTQHRAFTLHGLWPQNTDGTYPEDCSEAPGPASPSQYTDIYPDPTLLQHEWQTHGTCSGLTPDRFFTLARDAERSVHIPPELSHLTQPATLTPAQITALFAEDNPSLPPGSFALTCGNNYLTAVEVCLDRNLKATTCSAVQTCRANQVRIPAPQ